MKGQLRKNQPLSDVHFQAAGILQAATLWSVTREASDVFLMPTLLQ